MRSRTASRANGSRPAPVAGAATRPLARRLAQCALVVTGVVVTALWPWSARAEDTLRCDSGLVSVGATPAEVEARCGSPSFRDTEVYALPRNHGVAAERQIWTYNFGPDQLLQVLRFRAGRLADIRSAGYGFSGSPQGRCDPYDIAVGMTKYALLFHCGQPMTKTAASVLAPLVPVFPNGVVRRLPNGVYAPVGGYQRQVYRERWVYNFGPKYLLRDVTLENGRVTEVDTGDRGFRREH